MAAKTTLNAKNLEALGAKRLAELLIEVSKGSAPHQRRLRLELAGTQGTASLAREVRKRLTGIARARTVLDGRKAKSLAADLKIQRRTIVDVVSKDDPNEAFELIWQYLALADPIFERSGDGSGTLIETFHDACSHAAALAEAATIQPDVLAARIAAAIRNNAYGQYDPLIGAMAPVLGSAGLGQLKRHLEDWAAEPEDTPDDEDREVIGYGPSGPIYWHTVYGRHKDLTIRTALQDIGDAEGDVDAYIAQQSETARQAPGVATNIATRLIAAQRPGEALGILDAADPGPGLFIAQDWQNARLAALEALGRGDEAQAARWAWFSQTLDPDHLRAHLKRLPDFDDLDAEDRAFAHARAFPDVHQALHFFLTWPALGEAARLVLTRRDALDGNLYELLTEASEALSAKHPLAATLALRAMIDFTLDHARSSRYRYAAAHLKTCADLAPHVPDADGVEPHEAYLARLKRQHGRKPGFWSLTG